MINDNRKLRSEYLQVQRETESVIVISLLSQSRNEDYSNDIFLFLFFFWYPGMRRQIIFARYSIQFWIQSIVLLTSRFHETFSRKELFGDDE